MTAPNRIPDGVPSRGLRPRGRLCTAWLLVAVCSAPAAFAQERPAAPEPANEATQADGEGPSAGGMMPEGRMMSEGRTMPEMREMAGAMKSMADTCRMMMEREMRYRPVWIAAAAGVGTLLTVALALFVALEIQWIRFWGLRIRAERKNLAGS